MPSLTEREPQCPHSCKALRQMSILPSNPRGFHRPVCGRIAAISTTRASLYIAASLHHVSYRPYGQRSLIWLKPRAFADRSPLAKEIQMQMICFLNAYHARGGHRRAASEFAICGIIHVERIPVRAGRLFGRRPERGVLSERRPARIGSEHQPRSALHHNPLPKAKCRLYGFSVRPTMSTMPSGPASITSSGS
jgi:hypothetical protein